MTRSHHDRPGEIVDVLLSIPDDRREAAARLMCGDDEALRRAVDDALSAAVQEALLQRLREETGLREERVTEDAAAASAASGMTEERGARIGPYRLLERIGEGGFGVVYIAEQAGSLSRRVALKIIKEGMDTRAVVARFEAERQALAIMDHPSIAKIFDAGTTPGGRPYFVMELVRGVSITQYCEENRLSPRERVELMIPVCQAIQHAHQKGIIHRDIKPGNVLVGVVDGKPVPKVIDFGIAKAMAGPLTDKTVYTAFRQFVGTPTYMSPEQLLQSGVDVDTRADVYSLGVLMYELLTGSPPYDTEALLKLGIEAMQNAVRETDPPKPSNRVMTMEAGRRTSVATARRLQPDRLEGVLRGELDWMVMKAVEKDRVRRYQAASELAEDLNRFLSGEPVRAGPPSGLYRARKFIRRNRGAAVMAGVVLAGLMTTLVGTAVGLRREAAARAVAVENARIAQENEARARSDRARAESSAKATESAMRFMDDVLSGADSARHEGRQDITVREMLDKAVQWADAGHDSAGRPLVPEVEAGIRQSLSGTYYGIGRYDDGLVQAQKALKLIEGIHGGDSLPAFDALGYVARGLWNTGKPLELERIARRRLALVDSLKIRNTLRHSFALDNLSLSFHSRGMAAEALAASRLRLTMLESMNPRNLTQIRGALHEVAINSFLVGKSEEALIHCRRNVEMTRAAGHELSLARRLALLGHCLMSLDRLEEAEEACRQSMEIVNRLQGPDHPGPTYERLALIRVLILRGKVEEAAARFAHLEKLPVPKRETVARQIPWMKALLLRAQGHPEQAIRMYEEMQRAGIAAGWNPMQDPVLDVVAKSCGAYNDVHQFDLVIREGSAYLRRGRELLGTDATNTVLRPLAREILRACNALDTPQSRAIAADLIQQYPALEPATPLGKFTPSH